MRKPKPRTCTWCGITFTPPKRRSTCSEECLIAARTNHCYADSGAPKGSANASKRPTDDVILAYRAKIYAGEMTRDQMAVECNVSESTTYLWVRGQRGPRKRPRGVADISWEPKRPAMSDRRQREAAKRAQLRAELAELMRGNSNAL